MTTIPYADRATWDKRYRYDRANGRRRLTDSAPVLARVEELRDAGWSIPAIAEVAGLTRSVVYKLAERQQPTVRVPTARAILALRPEDTFTRPNPDGFVPAVGARRRIRALLAMGWTHEHMRKTSGVYTSGTLNQSGDWVARSTHEAIAAMYDQLAMTPGPSTCTRNKAAKRGYAPPLAWDDGDLDNPDATPANGTDPGRRKRVHLDDIEFLLGTEPMATVQWLADRLTVDRSTIQGALARAGRTDLLQRLARNAEVAA